MASASTSYGIGNVHFQFDVFINHRGPDVKKGLASHLYHRLTAHGLRVFLDREELQVGNKLTPQIEGAIKTASVHVAIFSPLYAESSWCLNELVQILETGSTIIPVFYDVNPSDLRWTRDGDGVYARALRMLKEKRGYNSGTIAEWRMALFDVAEISGFELKACNRDEGLLVEKVVQQVLNKGNKTLLNVAKYPTGLFEKIEDLEKTILSQQQRGKITVVGIVGHGGVGKTTLTKEYFNRRISNYDVSCFVSDVREKAAQSSLYSLQNILLKELAEFDGQINSADEGIEKLKKHISPFQRAIIVLDDVDHIDQLNALFLPVKDTIHSDSLILVTSRNKKILRSSGIVDSSFYKQTGLNRQHARELFCSHAFNHPHPCIGFEQLVEKFLDACDGLPLSLKVIGALLRGEDLEYWEAQLNKISKILPNDILSRLKISYDSLDEEEKQIFLDIACFFIGEDKDTAKRIWDGSDWQGWMGLWNLENKCLVEVDSKNCIRMHDHIRDLGRDIARKETPHRLWRLPDNLHNLSEQSCVRGISMVHGNEPEHYSETLAELGDSRLPAKMSRLQLLRAAGYSVERVLSVVRLPQLIYLCWENCPYSCLPSWITIKNLRVLHIQGANLETLWQHESQAPLQLRELNIDANILKVPKSFGTLKHLEKFVLHRNTYINGAPVDLETLPDEFCDMQSLKHLELKSCQKLTLLPQSVGKWTNLQRIDLGGCSILQMLPDSVGKWTNLQRIELGKCFTLKMLPYSVGNWTKLERIDLGECSSLHMLPDSVGKWMNLQRIDLGCCGSLQRLPDSVGKWANLQHIKLQWCSSLQMLPDSVGKWTNIQDVDLYGCSSLQILPDSVGKWTNLRSIHLDACSSLEMLPDSVEKWTNLQGIYFKGCSALQMLPDSAGNWTNLQRIDLVWCSALQMLPDSVGNWTNLQHISLSMCFALQMLPDSVGNWINLQFLDLRECSSLQMLPDSMGKLTNLQSIDLGRCSTLQMLPDSVGNWTNLKDIDLSHCSALQMLPHSIGNWMSLKFIDLSRCSALQMLPDSVGNLGNLQRINLSWCPTLQTLPDAVGNWTNLQHIEFSGCSSLEMLPDSLGNWRNLQGIDLGECSTLKMLPESVGKLMNLQRIDLHCCTTLHMLPDSVGKLINLQGIDLRCCSNLQILPDLVGLTNLQSIDLGGCSALKMLPYSVGQLMNLQSMDLSGCSSLQMLPDSLGQLTKLQSIHLGGCSNLQMLSDSVGNLTNVQCIDLSVCPNLQWRGEVLELQR